MIAKYFKQKVNAEVSAKEIAQAFGGYCREDFSGTSIPCGVEWEDDLDFCASGDVASFEVYNQRGALRARIAYFGE